MFQLLHHRYGKCVGIILQLCGRGPIMPLIGQDWLLSLAGRSPTFPFSGTQGQGMKSKTVKPNHAPQRPRPCAVVANAPLAGRGAGSLAALGPMHAARRKGIVVVLALLLRSMCLAQSNDVTLRAAQRDAEEVYSFFSSASTPLTGYHVAVVSTSPIWVVGSAQNRFGIEECSYWTDSAGRAIPWPASRVKQLGDILHRYTRFCLWHVSISIPLPPIDFAFLAGFITLASGWILITRSTRRRTQTTDEPVKV